MKFVYYLRGLGCGLILAAFLVLIFGGTSKKTVKTSDNNDNAVVLEASSKNSIEKASEKPTEAATEKQTQAPTEAVTEKPAEAPIEKPTEPPTEAQTEAPSGEVRFMLDESFRRSEEVVAKLVELGIIKDEVAFNEYLNNTGYAENIQFGEKIMRQDMTFEELAKILCTE